jgi:predicted nucleotidyltransferase
MRTRNEYIKLLHSSDKVLAQRFGVRSLRLFGSVARNEHTSGSDVDICVETETPDPFLIMDLKEYLENLFGCSVDIV